MTNTETDAATLLAVNVYHEEAEPFQGVTGSSMRRQLLLTFRPGLDHQDDDDLDALYRHLNTLLLIGKVESATVSGEGQPRTVTAETIMCGGQEGWYGDPNIGDSQLVRIRQTPMLGMPGDTPANALIADASKLGLTIGVSPPPNVADRDRAVDLKVLRHNEEAREPGAATPGLDVRVVWKGWKRQCLDQPAVLWRCASDQASYGTSSCGISS
jgi:hypothetical protein